ncbi:MAG: carboxypeptidase regulatory-like domain-containing protein [Deltaproteobacteria bacterium]|nr:carboxypeptidase regulatory-like domain-containing protein [Deltaproteobacteria bacterium]
MSHRDRSTFSGPRLQTSDTFVSRVWLHRGQAHTGRPSSGLGLLLVSWLLVGMLCMAGSVQAETITGLVVDDATGDPLPNVTVIVDGESEGVTDENGRYRAEVASAGTYFLLIESPPAGYLGQLYAGIACFSRRTFTACPVNQGTPVVVGAGETVTDIDFSLLAEAQITGRITDEADDAPLAVEVNLYWAPEPPFGTEAVLTTVSEADGTYRFSALPAAEFFVATNASPYLDEIYDDLPCGLFCDPGNGTPITTVAGETSSGIDLALSLENRIEGKVTVPGGGPLPGGALWLHGATGSFRFFTLVDSVGDYSFEGLESGTYYVRTAVGREWVDEVYQDRLCPQADGTCDVTEGTPLVLAGGETRSGVDFALAVGARISGEVRAADDEDGLFASVDAYTVTGERVRTAASSDTGSYQLSGLAPGTYYLATRSAFGFLPQLYDGLPCGDEPEPTCDVTQGTPITVGFGDAVGGIDFALEREGACIASETRLCLNGGRFAVDIDWMTRAGNTGQGQAVDLTFADDSGYFWFFNASNVEVIVKVLDACDSSFNSFWVFAAGLTNVEVNLTVTDTLTGEIQTYLNPLQTPFEPILDTAAFDTCDATPQEEPVSSESGSAAALPERLEMQRWVSERVAELATESRATTGIGACQPGEQILCLRDGRFQVEAVWEQPNGNTGPASAEVLTDDTGFFWFFNPNNVEMVVKVLDACTSDTSRFWVFAGGQTNLGVTLRVTDTESGEVNTYVNPIQTPFQPVQDTDAFDTCPNS